jgi:HK97 family phage major capsid protein
MGSLNEERAAALKAAEDVVNGAKAASRDLTTDEVKAVDTHLASVDALDLQLKAASEAAATMKRIGALGLGTTPPDDDRPAKTLGDHFVKHAGERLREIRGVKGAAASAPEYKTPPATPPQMVGMAWEGLLTTEDPVTVTGYRQRLVIADLLGAGSMSGNAITYFVEGAMVGDFTTVAEGAPKPQIGFDNPTTVTDALKKIAGFIKFSDEMLEDLPFVVSEINTRLLYQLGRFEEAQLLDGPGTGTTLLGILRRGIQSETSTSTDDNADALFRATGKISTVTGLDADGIVIHPTDYEHLRLARDANEQYFGGGYFQGPYGNGAVLSQPPIWGMRTVVSPAVTKGTALVGAFAQGATVYRKGGVRVESTNSHDDDFTSNLVTVRAEERLALAVRYPAGFCQVTLL